jgi:hypothetical protein
MLNTGAVLRECRRRHATIATEAVLVPRTGLGRLRVANLKRAADPGASAELQDPGNAVSATRLAKSIGNRAEHAAALLASASGEENFG